MLTPGFRGNWIDLVIILVLIFFIHQGFVNGFWSILIDFISFFAALLISLRVYKILVTLLEVNFSLSPNLSSALGFLAMAIVLEIVIGFALTFLVSKLPRKILKNHFTKLFGIVLSFGQGIILIAFALTFAIALPINPSVKTDISNSKIGGFILTKTTRLEKDINNILGGAVNDYLTYLTIEPDSNASVPLEPQTVTLTVDEASEKTMFTQVNSERTKNNTLPLVADSKLSTIARDYAKFMWNNHYFGHTDPEGHDVGDRLEGNGFSYTLAGENLALAPTVEIAHNGLMNSDGHRANILENRFSKIGIGVIDNGYYGKIFVQVFTN